MSPPLLECREVCKTYPIGKRIVTALDPISLSVKPEEFLVIRGPSGSGKSTLLNLLSGLEQPTSGSVWFSGKELHSLQDKEISQVRNSSFGFVFQTPHVLFDRTVIENIQLPGRYSNSLNNRALSTRAFELLEYVGLADLAERMPNTLSGGELQRVAFGRALVGDPEIIFADEPTGSLDEATSQVLLDLLKDQCRQNRAVIMVTHDRQAMAFGSRSITLEKIRQAEVSENDSV